MMKTSTRLLVLLAVCGIMPAGAGLISIQPAAITVTPGQSFSLDLRITGASDLYAYQVDVGFNPSILFANSVTEGTFITGTTFIPGSIDNSGGTIAFIADSLDGPVPGVNGNGTLVTISFSALASGASSVDPFNILALNSFGEGLSVSAAVGNVTVTATPEPSTLVLSAVVLGVIMLARRRSRGARAWQNTNTAALEMPHT
jgi:hypothetical protein